MSPSTPLLFLNGQAPRALLERLGRHRDAVGAAGGFPLFGQADEMADGWGVVKGLWAADGGANALWKHGLPAEAIVGDLDSVDPEALRWHAECGARVLHRPDQNSNDLEKALAELLTAGHTRCWVAAFEGGRLDMLLGLGTWLSPARRPRLRLAGAEQLVIPLDAGCHSIFLGQGTGFSLVAPDPCTISLKGAHWAGSGLCLKPGCQGVSNRAAKDIVQVEVHQGWVLLFLRAPWALPAESFL